MKNSINQTSVGALNAGVQPDRRASGDTGRQEFRRNLKLLDRSNSRLRWSGVLTLLLISGTIALLSLSTFTRVGPSPKPEILLAVLGLLGVMLVLMAFSLWEQRHLRTLRSNLVEQMESATRHRVRADRVYGLSILDPLTRLYNRRFGETRLKEEIARTVKTGTPLLLLAIDFDRFKEINDLYGHAAGDMALKEFARRLQRAIRSNDVPVRVGGDEFLVILPECPPDKVHIVLSRLTSFELELDGRKIPVSYSRGVAQYQVRDTPKTLIRRADERLYAEKAQRRLSSADPDRLARFQPAGSPP